MMLGLLARGAPSSPQASECGLRVEVSFLGPGCRPLTAGGESSGERHQWRRSG